jgi:hypothetical protein
MLTERIKTPSSLKPGTKFFTVMQYTYPSGQAEIVSMSLDETNKTDQGLETKHIEVAIDYTHSKQRECSPAYYAHNLTNEHIFDAFKKQDNTQVEQR